MIELHADPVALLEGQVGRSSSSPAVREADSYMSYEEFWDLCHRYRETIANRCSGAPVVAIVLPGGANAYAAMFAALMSGGHYVPINTQWPDARIRDVLAAVEPDVLVSEDNRGSELLGDLSVDLISPGQLTANAAAIDSIPGAVAYVIFTSGSTGRPKGVVVPRSALANYLAWVRRDIGPAVGDRWSQHPNIGFDLSVLDIYGALCHGAELFPLPEPRSRLFPARAIREHQLTIWNSVPSAVDGMMRSRDVTYENLNSLRLMTFCGEPLRSRHLEAIFNSRPDLHVLNTYGPTENTVSCTVLWLDATNWRSYASESVALGQPIPGTNLRLDGGVDATEGEILLGGRQLANGYWRDRDTTASAFITVDGERYYRTGDYGRFQNGSLYFIERIDSQVKIHGHRVELGEVGHVVSGLVGSSVEVVEVDEQLIAFIEARSEFDRRQLDKQAREYLPPYSVPVDYVSIDVFPRTDNDKVDYKSLRAIAREGRS